MRTNQQTQSSSVATALRSNTHSDSRMPVAQKLNLLRMYGRNPISYSSVQEGLFDYHMSSLGFASYGRRGSHRFVLGDPLCSSDDCAALLQAIVRDLKNPAFVQVSESSAEILHRQFGYKVTQLGVETNIPVQEYHLENDTRKRNLRAFVRKGRAQTDVRELTERELKARGVSEGDLERLTEDWLSDKASSKPLRLLVRNTVYADEPHVRKFYSFDHANQLQGFVFFNPMFEHGRVFGYCADIMRASSSATKGHVPYMIISALDKFRSEGISVVSLGLSPCAGLRKGPFRHDAITYAILRKLYQYGNALYSFKGIHENKREYNAPETRVYVATRRRFSLPELWAITRYIGIL